MKGGIPQGSALGPLMFLIYMSSLPSQLTDGLLLHYVDDMTVICSAIDPTAVQTIMCSQHSLIQHRVLQSKMRINFKKSSVMWFRAMHQVILRGFCILLFLLMVLSLQ